jgi:hypothetical protein
MYRLDALCRCEFLTVIIEKFVGLRGKSAHAANMWPRHIQVIFYVPQPGPVVKNAKSL